MRLRRPSVRVEIAPSTLSSESPIARNWRAMPSLPGTSVSLLANSFFSSGRFASAVSSLPAVTLRLPSRCISRPTSDSRVNTLDAPELEPISVRIWRCRPTAVLSPCSGPPVLLAASYFTSPAISVLSAL